MKKQLIITAVTLTILGAGLAGATHTYAQTPTSNPVDTLIQKIADKFHLNKADVQSVFDQDRQERQTTMEQKYEAKLDQLVKDGKITAAQKILILNKHKELEAARLANKNSKQTMTKEQRKAAMDKERTDLQNWAKSNNIDLKYLMGFGMKGYGFRMMHDNDKETNDDVTPTVTQ